MAMVHVVVMQVRSLHAAVCVLLTAHQSIHSAWQRNAALASTASSSCMSFSATALSAGFFYPQHAALHEFNELSDELTYDLNQIGECLTVPEPHVRSRRVVEKIRRCTVERRSRAFVEQTHSRVALSRVG